MTKSEPGDQDSTRKSNVDLVGSGFDLNQSEPKIVNRSDSIDFWLRKMGTDDMALDLARVGVSQTLQKEVEVILIDAPRYPPVIRRCLSADSYPPKMGMVNRLCTEPGDS